MLKWNILTKRGAITPVFFDDFKGRTWVQITHPDDVEPATKIYMDGFNKRESCSFENRQKGTNGIYRTILWKATPRFSPTGEFIGMMGVGIDIDERKKAENALKESEQQFIDLAENMPQLAWMADDTGWIFWYNKQWYLYTNTTEEQMKGWGWQSVHDPKTLPKVLERWKKSIESGMPFDMVFPLKGADNIFRPFLTRVIPLKDRNGKIIKWFGTNTDITEQKKNEDALKESERMLHKSYDDLEAKVTFRNMELEKLNKEYKRKIEELEAKLKSKG